jgi:hypothetical protein
LNIYDQAAEMTPNFGRHAEACARFKLKMTISPGGAMTAIEYKGHRIEVSPVGKGWRAAIFAPGSTRAIADSPSNLEKSRSEEIVAEAKRIIDARLHDK